MARLADCLRKAGLSQHEAAILKGKVDELKGEEYGAHEAAVEAVKAHIRELEAQKNLVVQQVAMIDYSLVPAVADDASDVINDGNPKIPLGALARVDYGIMSAMGGRPLAQDEVDIFATGIRDLVRLGAPLARFDGIDVFYVFKGEGANFSVAVDSSKRQIGKPASGMHFGIGINHEMIYQMLGDDAHSPLAQLRTAWLAHESWHNADFNPGGRDFRSSGSPLFEIGFAGQKRVAKGAVLKEALDAYESERNTNLSDVLRYPLGQWDVPRARGYGPSTEWFQQETFAQLGRLYDTNRELLRKELPLAYNLFDRIAQDAKSAKTIDDVRSAVRAALRPSGAAVVAAAPVDTGAGGPDQPGAGVRKLTLRVGQAAGRGRAIRGPEGIGRGINIEVAPSHEDDILHARFDRIAEADKRETTYEVAKRFIPRVLNDMGLKGLAQFTIGGYDHGTAPAIIVRFGPKVPYDTMVEAGKVLGYVFNQKAVVAFDEDVKTGEGLRGFVKVEGAKALSYEQQQKIFAHVDAAFPKAGGFTGHNGAMVFGNFSDLSDADFHAKLKAALASPAIPGSLTTSLHAFKSDWIEPATLEGTRYGTSNGAQAEAGRAGVRGPGYIDSLRDEAGQKLGRHVAAAEAARQEAALIRELSRVNRHLTAEERELLFDKRRNRLITILDEIPVAPREFMHAALAGQANKGWYRRSRQAIEGLYGQDAPRFLALMAALSPQTSVRGNFYNAARVWAAWLRAGRTTDPARMQRIFNENLLTEKGLEDRKSAMQAWSQNGARALTTISPETVRLSGPKVDSFRSNLFGDLYEVTNDRHMAGFIGVLQDVFEGLKTTASQLLTKGPGYIAANVRTRQAAELLTRATGESWSPAEVQETVWSFWKALYDLADAKGETRSALQLLRSGALTHEMIANVPDLGSFVHEEQYRAITRAAPQGRGVGPEAGLRPAEARAAGETGAIAPTAVLEGVARRVDRSIAQRAEEKAAKAAAKAAAAMPAPLLGDEGAGVISDEPKFSLAPPTESEAFKKWFGDSKVVDADGKPMVVYHGTSAERVQEVSYGTTDQITEFQPETYFSANKNEAESYSRVGGSKQIYAVYLSIRNPLVTEDYDFFAGAHSDAAALERQGYDGVEYRVEGEQPQYLAFQSTQIKSATGNNGEFSPANPDIRFSDEGAKGQLSVADVQKTADAIGAKFQNAAPVVVVPDVASLPFPADERARGAFWQGNVYLVAENIESAGAARFTYLHEQTGHYGLRGVFGSALNGVMEQVYDSNETVRQLADASMARAEGMTKALATEEALADLAGSGKIQALPQWKLLLAAIRKALRDLGFKLDMSDNDIAALLANAKTFVEKGDASTWMPRVPALSEKAPPFYSALAQNIGKAPFNKKGEIAPSQLRAWLDSKMKEGLFKSAEVEWSGLNELLSMTAEATLTRDEINTFLDQNRVRVGEKVLGDVGLLPSDWTVVQDPDGRFRVYDDEGQGRGAGNTRAAAILDAVDNGVPHSGVEFASWQLQPAGKGYRELLITLRTNKDERSALQDRFLRGEITQEEVDRTLAAMVSRPLFTAGHFSEPNVLVHIRFNERAGPDGKRTLFIEEIQSDWAQKGRKQGFANEKEPAPVTELPEGWTVKQYTPRRANKPSFVKALGGRYNAFLREAKEAEIIGGRERNIDTFGSEEDAIKYLALAATMRAQFGLEPSKLSIPISGMSGKEAFEQLAEMFAPHNTERMKAALDEMYDMIVQRERPLGKRWGVFTSETGKAMYAHAATADKAKAEALKGLNEQQRAEWIERGRNAIPSGPFVQKTEQWVALALKRMIRYAAENNFDQVAWTTGKQQAERYSMSKQVNEISWGNDVGYDKARVVLETAQQGRIILYVGREDNVVASSPGLRGAEGKSLDEVVGKELAGKIMATQSGSLQGLDLDIGGEGHKVFYDRMVRNIANDLLKKYGGGQVSEMSVVIEPKRTVPEYEVRRMSRGDRAYWRVRGPAGSEGPEWTSQGQAQGYADLLTKQAEQSVAGYREEGQPQPGFTMTDKLRESAMSGLPLFSLKTDGVMGAITQEVIDRLSWGGNKFNWIHKSISTQYHKAQINKWFRPVYQGVQRYMMDQNAMAADAAELAGDDVVPQLKNFGDAFRNFPGTKNAKQLKADIEAVGRAVFVGTLGDYRPSDRDLTNGFYAMLRDEDGNPLREVRAQPLNGRQREMYERVRAAIDLSLAQASASEMVKLTRLDGVDDARAEAKDNPEDAADILLVALHEKKILSIAAAADSEGEAQAAFEQTAAAADSSITKIQELRKQFKALKDRGYAPLSRFGQYTIDVSQQVDGELKRTAFFMYETKNDANKALRNLRELYPDAVIEAGTMNPEAWKGMQGFSLDSLETFAHATGMDTGQFGDAVQDYLKLAVSNRSALKRLIARKGYEGFSEDLPRVLSGFITSQARLAARNYHMGDVMRAQYAIPTTEGETRGEADKLVGYITNPIEEAHVVRGLLFVNFIGGSIASALQNITQPVMMTAPYLAQFGGPNVVKAVKASTDALAHALAVMRDPTKGSIALRQAIVQAAHEGVTEPQEIHQLHAEAIRGFGSNQAWRRAVKLWSAPFSLAESFNRKLTFNAAFEMAEKMGMEAINDQQEELAARRGLEPVTFTTPYEFATHVVTDTQGLYNKGNRPNWARGPIGATAFTFKQFSIAYVEFLLRLPNRERFLALGLLVLAAGAGGLPFADDASDILDTIGQALGYGTNSRKAVREWAARTVGEAGGAFLTGGVTNLPGSPVNLAGRFGMGNLIPGTAFFAQSTADAGNELAQAAGPLGSVLASAHTAFQAAQGGEWGVAGRTVAPRAVSDLLQAINMSQVGYYRDTKGRKVIDTTGVDAMFKSVGLQPGAVAHAQTLAQGVRQDIALHAAVETAIADRWARGIIDHDEAAVRSAIEDLFAWNLRNPDQRISIQPAQIQRRVREAMTERATRLIKSAPKEIRSQVSQSLAG